MDVAPQFLRGSALMYALTSEDPLSGTVPGVGFEPTRPFQGKRF